MPTMEEYAKQPREQRRQRLDRTADELAAAIKGQSDAVLSRRPDAKNWAAKEVVCHLRDTEEIFGARIEQILAMDVDPKLVVTNPDRRAEERQYLANPTVNAVVVRLYGEARTTMPPVCIVVKTSTSEFGLVTSVEPRLFGLFGLKPTRVRIPTGPDVGRRMDNPQPFPFRRSVCDGAVR